MAAARGGFDWSTLDGEAVLAAAGVETSPGVRPDELRARGEGGSRSLSIDVARGVWIDHSTGQGGHLGTLLERHLALDWLGVRRWLEARGLKDAWRQEGAVAAAERVPVDTRIGRRAERHERMEAERDVRWHRAQRLWDAAVEADFDTGAYRYLAGRGVWPPGVALPGSVRFLAAGDWPLGDLPRGCPDGVDGFVLYAMARSGAGLCAVGVDALVDGRLSEPRYRRAFGVDTHAPFVARHGTPGGGVLLGEGAVDALALASQSPQDASWACWSCGGTAGMRALVADGLGGERRVCIAEDGGQAGVQGARGLAARLRGAGCLVSVSAHAAGEDAASSVAGWVGERIALGMDAGDAWRALRGAGLYRPPVARKGAVAAGTADAPVEKEVEAPAAPTCASAIGTPTPATVAAAPGGGDGLPPRVDGLVWLYLDIETVWRKKDYSLKRMGMEAYVRDPRWGIHCVALAQDDGAVEVVGAAGVGARLAAIEWGRVALVAHNAPFEAMALAHHHGHSPALVVDTAGLARLAEPRAQGGGSTPYSLAACVERWGLGEKGDELGLSDGVMLPGGFLLREDAEALAAYCRQDVVLLRRLHAFLDARIRGQAGRVGRSPDGLLAVEYAALDDCVRATSEPVLEWDEAAWGGGGAVDQALMALAKDDCFAERLRALGVEPPRQVGKDGMERWAFAKKGAPMLALGQHADPRVRHLVSQRRQAREGDVRQRARKLGLTATRGAIPAGLNAGGAHTGRDTGGGGINTQNLPHRSTIRDALVAPDGWTLVAGDLAQIECRVNALLAGEQWVLDAFAAGRDVYCEFASRMYGKPVAKGDPERKVGKVAVLGCGYQMGTRAFLDYAMGMGVALGEAEARRTVDAFRDAHPRIVASWRQAQERLAEVARGGGAPWQAGTAVLRVEHEAILLPSGRTLRYPGITATRGEWGQEWACRAKPGETAHLYGGKVWENIVQAVARDVLWEQAARLRPRLQGRARLVLRIHDELVYACRQEDAAGVAQAMREEMEGAPSWLPGLVLEAEIATARSFGGLKG